MSHTFLKMWPPVIFHTALYDFHSNCQTALHCPKKIVGVDSKTCSAEVNFYQSISFPVPKALFKAWFWKDTLVPPSSRACLTLGIELTNILHWYWLLWAKYSCFSTCRLKLIIKINASKTIVINLCLAWPGPVQFWSDLGHKWRLHSRAEKTKKSKSASLWNSNSRCFSKGDWKECTKLLVIFLV